MQLTSTTRPGVTAAFLVEQPAVLRLPSHQRRTGRVTATLTIVSNAPDSPHMVTLGGTGTAPVLAVSQSSLDFGEQALGSTSLTRTLTVTNTGTAPLLLTNIGVTGTHASDFRHQPTCGSSLAVGRSCRVDVTFRPTTLGSRTAELSIMTNASGSPHMVSLTGIARRTVLLLPLVLR